MVLLTNASLVDGTRCAIRLDGEFIVAVGDLAAVAGEAVIDLAGYLVLPAPAEPHAHLDKAFTADLVPNPAGDLDGAIEVWLRYRTTITKADFVERAVAAALWGLRNGTTAIRSHVDVAADVGLVGIEALLEVKAKLAGRVDLQLVGLVGYPTGGPKGAPNLAMLRAALEMGLDVVGGCPHIDEDRVDALHQTMELAAEFDVPIDLHTDENLDPNSLDLELFAERVTATGFTQATVASHCVSLAMQETAVQQRVAEKVAAADMAVVTLPQTNLFLQARDIRQAPPRGLTALASLDDADVLVCAGADNLQDPFCTVGRGDPLETAALLVMAGHYTPHQAYDMVSNNARRALGLQPVEIEAGRPAELLAVKAPNLRAAVASAPSDRLVFHRGNLVARTETTIIL